MTSVGAVNSVSSSIKAPNKIGAFTRRVYNSLPNKVIKKDFWLNGIVKVSKNISSAEQRLILGATALLTQPFIDAHNKDVDERTRKVSVARTIAKIIAGTLTGFAIRKGCIKIIGAWSKKAGDIDKFGNPVKLNKLNTFFTPTCKMSDNIDDYKQYKNALGTIFALFIMVFTNFLIDAPLTKFLTNIMISKDKTEGKSP